LLLFLWQNELFLLRGGVVVQEAVDGQGVWRTQRVDRKRKRQLLRRGLQSNDVMTPDQVRRQQINMNNRVYCVKKHKKTYTNDVKSKGNELYTALALCVADRGRRPV